MEGMSGRQKNPEIMLIYRARGGEDDMAQKLADNNGGLSETESSSS